MKPAVFIDRDGTIIRHVDHMRRVEDLRLLPKAADAIALLNKMHVPVFIVTNQPVIARGWMKEDELMILHEELQGRLRKKGAHVDAVYYCPHHPDANLAHYRVKCSCRKPGPGMFKRAVREFNIDLKKSFIIGDQTADVTAGNRLSMTSILVTTGRAGMDGKFETRPDRTAKNLYEAAILIKRLLV